MTTSQKRRIFISYRRADSAGYAGRIYDRLTAHFGEDAIFMDVDTIEGGLDFVKVLEDAVQSCDVLIALIGRQWLDAKDEDGNRRLDNPKDFVRIEISTALNRDIRVIPVLVDGIGMPRSTELPENLKTLAQRNALQVNHHSFNPDVYRLITHIESALDAVEKAAREKVEKEAAEKAAREKAEREAAERIAREKAERERAEKVAREKAEQVAVEKTLREKAKRVGEEAAREKEAKPRSKQTHRRLSLQVVAAIIGMVAIILVAIIGSPTFIYLINRTPEPTLTATLSNTPTKFPTVSKTLRPTVTRTEVPTSTSTHTPIPTESILLQEDFEDSIANGWFSWGDVSWTKPQEPNWSIEQEPGGNHYASATGPSDIPICYGDRALGWTDYVFESRIKFVIGSRLDIYVHANCGKAQYAVAIQQASGHIDFAQWNELIGYTGLSTVISKPFVRNRWYTIRIEINGELFSMYVDNSLVKTQKLSTPLIIKQGGIGYQFAGEKFYFDDIKVWSLK